VTPVSKGKGGSGFIDTNSKQGLNVRGKIDCRLVDRRATSTMSPLSAWLRGTGRGTERKRGSTYEDTRTFFTKSGPNPGTNPRQSLPKPGPNLLQPRQNDQKILTPHQASLSHMVNKGVTFESACRYETTTPFWLQRVTSEMSVSLTDVGCTDNPQCSGILQGVNRILPDVRSGVTTLCLTNSTSVLDSVTLLHCVEMHEIDSQKSNAVQNIHAALVCERSKRTLYRWACVFDTAFESESDAVKTPTCKCI
jgi:hypothetical protein